METKYYLKTTDRKVCEDDVLSDLKIMKLNNWIKNGNEWKRVVEKVKTLAVDL